VRASIHHEDTLQFWDRTAVKPPR